MSILFCLRYGIGDVVMELPAIRALGVQHPDAALVGLGARPALQLVEDDPDFAELVCIQDFGFDHWGDPGSRQSRQAFRQWFDAGGFELVVDPFHAVFGIQDILTQSGIPWRNSSPVPDQSSTQPGHGIEVIWRSAAESWQLDSAGRIPDARLCIPAEMEAAAATRLPEPGTGELVGIAAHASSMLKRWPVERMARVVRWLLEETGRRVVVFGIDREQEDLLRPLAPVRHHPGLSLLPPLHLQETAALLRRCDAFVSNDTGLMHLAAAVHTPTLGVFGPTSARIYLPPRSLALSSDRPCDYRLTRQFGPPRCVHAGHCLIADNSCIDSISTEAVIRGVEQLLSSPAARSDSHETGGGKQQSMGREVLIGVRSS